MHGFNSYFLVIYFCYYCYHHCCSHPPVYEVEHSECFGINGWENVTLTHHTFVVYNTIHQTIVVYNYFIYSIDFLKLREYSFHFLIHFLLLFVFVFIIFAFIFKVWPAVLQKNNNFFELKIFFCAGSSWFCRHETLLPATSNIFVDMKHFFV